MAMIDYGAVVFKNGKQINHEFFDDMLVAVGWVDRKRKLYEDCDRVWGHGVSDCVDCPRAKREHRVMDDGYEYDMVVGDCRGNELPKGGSIDGNYFAFAGDGDFTLAFYKTGVLVVIGKEPADHIWECGYRHYGDPDRRSYRAEYGGIRIRIKHVCKNVYHLSMVYKGDYYHVVYGGGIDPDMDVWNRVKVQYLGGRGAKAVDRLYKRIGGVK
jgi:hypothetical protein